MKKNFFAGAVLLLLTIFTTSCQKERLKEGNDELSMKSQSRDAVSVQQLGKKEFELQVKPISSKQLADIASKLQKRRNAKGNSLNKMVLVEELPVEGEISPITDDVQEIQIILNPLVTNGRQIHSELISKVTTTPDWQLLSSEEQNAMLNLSDDQLGELSLIYSTVDLNDWQYDPLVSVIDVGLIRSCLSGALGLGELYYLIVENPAALLRANGALKILKHVGLRYLGWIGLGLAVWDFVDCVS